VIAPEVRELPKPVLGFAGNMQASKVDFDLLEAVAKAWPAGTLLLVGPERPETETQLRRLASLPNVRWVGMKPYAELPSYVAAFDVALIPYLENEYTRSCFPLKVFEYLAAGKPVVASGLPELVHLVPDIVLASGTREYLRGIESALESADQGSAAQRMALAAQNTWETRTERLLGLVEAELAAAGT
jgi:glycosyltransferase involved in cell wall biosynthesis